MYKLIHHKTKYEKTQPYLDRLLPQEVNETNIVVYLSTQPR